MAEVEVEWRCFVGNLDASVTSNMLHEAFEVCGAVSAKVAMDRRTDKSQGFGHVSFPNREAMEEAILLMNGTKLAGAVMIVHEHSSSKTPGNSRTPRRTRMSTVASGSSAKNSAKGAAALSAWKKSGKSSSSCQESSPPNLKDWMPNGRKKGQSVGSKQPLAREKEASSKGQSEKKGLLGFLLAKPSPTAQEQAAAFPKSTSENTPRSAPQGRPHNKNKDSTTPRGHSMPLKPKRGAGE